VEFEGFSIDEAAVELHHGGRHFDLTPQGMRLLMVLLERRGRAEKAQAGYHRWDPAQAADSEPRTFGVALSIVQAGRYAEALDALSSGVARRDMGFVTLTVDPRASLDPYESSSA
jgi:hypothetical protein